MDYVGMDITKYNVYSMLLAAYYFTNCRWMSFIVDQSSSTILEVLMLIFVMNIQDIFEWKIQ